MNSNYPAGFTQAMHDEEFADAPECIDCGKQFDGDGPWCAKCLGEEESGEGKVRLEA